MIRTPTGREVKTTEIDQCCEHVTKETTNTIPGQPPKPPAAPIDPEPPAPTTQPRRSTRQRTESAYIWILRDRVGTHDGQNGEPVLPRGIQAVALEGRHENEGENAAAEADAAVSLSINKLTDKGCDDTH